ncbi:MAG: hypothetical protein CME19_25340 [Gemmatimonadetes bacterium]|nr:hypothetical protein [Gemmatimonadota bacterium]
MTPFQQKLKGSIPAMVTAMREDFSVDADAMKRTASRLLEHGSRGVVVMGTSGEFAGINDDQRPAAITSVVEEVCGRVPVVVGCGQPNVKRTHEQARQAGDLGAEGILVNPPFYFPMTQDEVVSFFANLVEASPVPVMLYNIPSMTKVSVEPATIPKLADVGVQGCKDSSGSPSNTLAYLAALEPDSDFRVTVGGDAFFVHLLDAGVCASTSLMPNVCPQLTPAIHDAWEAGDYKEAFAAQHRSNTFTDIFRPLHPFLISAAKAILSKIGLMEPWAAPPKPTLSAEETAEAYEAVKSFIPDSLG